MAEKKRQATPGDMIRSIAVIMLPVIALTWLLTSTPEQPDVPLVPWRQTLADARAQAPWPVVAPEGLPEGPTLWRATAAHWSKAGEPGPVGRDPSPRNQWFVGLISPDTIHYGLYQADGEPDSYVREVARDARKVGSTTIDGAAWDQLETLDGRTRAMAHRSPQNVVVVVADTDLGHLDQFARTLKTS